MQVKDYKVTGKTGYYVQHDQGRARDKVHWSLQLKNVTE